MGACETTPPATHARGTTQPAQPSQPITSRLSSLPVIGRRSPASSSFVLAAGLTADPGLRALDPDHATARTGTSEEKPAQQFRQSPARPPGHRARPARPLDKLIPHGCGLAGWAR